MDTDNQLWRDWKKLTKQYNELHDENKKLKALVKTGVEVVEDFLPNIGVCALQDYGRLNQFLIDSNGH